MQAREYRRRLVILSLVLILPVAFWVSLYCTAGDDPTPTEVPTHSGTEIMMIPHRESYPSIMGVMGVAWAAAVTAFYTISGSILKDKRLVLCGYRPWQILAARLILLMGVVLLVSTIPVILFVPTIAPLHPELVWLASFLAGLIALEIGLFIGVFVPRPTEGTLIIIAILGIGMAVHGDAARFFPTYPSNQLLLTGLFAENPLISPFLWNTLLILAALGVLTAWLWYYRVRIRG
jgi:hypothetical protein